MQVELLE